MPRIDIHEPYLNRYPYKLARDYGAPPYLEIPVERSGCIYEAVGSSKETSKSMSSSPARLVSFKTPKKIRSPSSNETGPPKPTLTPT